MKRPIPDCRREPLLPALLIFTLLIAPGAARGADEVVTVSPVLVSTDATGPDWETVAQLRQAAEDGDAVACFQYAQLLEWGDQVARDEAAAFTFYQQAASQDHVDAVFRLGQIHHDGLLGQAVDQARAFPFYRQAADLGVPRAVYNVGAMLASGRGVKTNYGEGLAWLLLAQELGADPGSVDQVRHRLSRYPRTLAKAQVRYAEIQAEWAARAADSRTQLENDAVPAPSPPVAPVIVPADAVIKPVIEAPTLPGFDPVAPNPSVVAPIMAIPRTTPPPAAPETASEPPEKRH